MSSSPSIRPHLRKASDEQLLAAYGELKSVKKVGRLFGMCGQSVHERLQKLGASRPRDDLFTEQEKDRIRAEYPAAAAAGKLADLAASMGRTKSGICRIAGELGLTDQSRPRVWLATWKYLTEADARPIFEQFKRSSLNLGQYCNKMGYEDLGFSNCMKKFFPDEWEHVIEAKQIKQTRYRHGRQFEYRVRDYLKSLGYVALRSPGSKTPIDLVAIKPGVVLFIQCKRNGALLPKEWNDLFDLAASTASIPLLASTPSGRGSMRFQRLVGRKVQRYARQPLEPFDPAQAGTAVRITEIGGVACDLPLFQPRLVPELAA